MAEPECITTFGEYKVHHALTDAIAARLETGELVPFRDAVTACVDRDGNPVDLDLFFEYFTQPMFLQRSPGSPRS
jgi:hypothetical protein